MKKTRVYLNEDRLDQTDIELVLLEILKNKWINLTILILFLLVGIFSIFITDKRHKISFQYVSTYMCLTNQCDDYFKLLSILEFNINKHLRNDDMLMIGNENIEIVTKDLKSAVIYQDVIKDELLSINNYIFSQNKGILDTLSDPSFKYPENDFTVRVLNSKLMNMRYEKGNNLLIEISPYRVTQISPTPHIIMVLFLMMGGFAIVAISFFRIYACNVVFPSRKSHN